MNPISDAVPVGDAATDPLTPAAAAQPVEGDAFAAMLAAAAALGPPPTPGQAEAARTAVAEGTEAGSDSPGPSDSIGRPLQNRSAVQAAPGYTPASGSLGEEIEGPTPEAPAAPQASEQAPAPAGLPVDDPAAQAPAPAPAPAVAEPRTLDSDNPAAVAYAQRRLQQLVRAGVIERVPDGDPTAAWRELSKDIRAIAESAGFTDPREFLAHGHVGQQQQPSPPQPPATSAPAKREETDIPVSFSTRADTTSAAPQVFPATRATATDQSSTAKPEIAPASEQSEPTRLHGQVAIDTEARAGSRAPAEATTTPATGVEAATVRSATPTAAGAPVAPRPVSAHLHELVDKAQATIRVAVREGHTDARITLRPAELGEVRITLRYEGGGVSALLTADSGKAVEALAQASADLRRSLEQQGLTVQGLDVRLTGDDARQGATPWRDGGPRVAPSGRYLADDDHDQQPEGGEPATRVTEAGRIDVLA